MISSAREQLIMQNLQIRAILSVSELSLVASVSESTIRRDLDRMEKKGLVKRTHGGAILLSEVEIDDHISIVQRRNGEQKQEIGLLAVELIKPGNTVYIDIGTTNLALAQHLPDCDITVITPSLPVVSLLSNTTEIRTVVLGGKFHAEYQNMDGPLTVNAIEQIQADLAFIGTSGMTASGVVRDTTSSQMLVKKAILSHADRKILLVDTSKIPGTGSYAVTTLEELDVIVTEKKLEGELHEICQLNDVEEVHP